ncbi:MSMEG_4193 family putative phosphomutase [Corynebacterium variabile]|uniref:MSMEG_4193 family putative phosphomutase n=1 Tax=Corynebacterium variabile TaxID=1727 RepID=UPI001D207641|nr:MSMEG_4193 family putative phosphomutase [Corynebacterium variabile]HJG46652.1 MSMEG_4193 family putative phosphomutase [Corynebacterium variabile]
MATVILVRHGRSTSNTAGVLAGRTPGVLLDDTGLEQARRTAERLAAIPLAAVVSSPLERTRQTADALLALQDATSPATLTVEDDLTECDYGDWQNGKLADLAKEPLWKTVTGQPSAAVFPGGESLAAMQTRAVAAVRKHDAQITEDHGKHAVWAAVSHGDIIKAVIADAYGMPFDNFQRVHADPASVTVISYTAAGPHVLCVNTTAGDLSWLAAGTRKDTPQDAPQVGGGAGH